MNHIRNGFKVFCIPLFQVNRKKAKIFTCSAMMLLRGDYQHHWTLCLKRVITWWISAWLKFQPAPRLKFYCNYMASLSPGFSTIFPLLPVCFIEKFHHSACPSSHFNLGWNLAAITWVFQPSSPRRGGGGKGYLQNTWRGCPKELHIAKPKK